MISAGPSSPSIKDSTLIAVIEPSRSRWLGGGLVPGLAREPQKKLVPGDGAASGGHPPSRRREPGAVWREHRGHSLRHLAERAGIGTGYLSQIENRERKGTVETLKKIAAALDVDLDDLT